MEPNLRSELLIAYTESSPLTLKNLSRLQVASIYKDSSIGNLINIVIVNLVVIHNEQVIKFIFLFFSICIRNGISNCCCCIDQEHFFSVFRKDLT